MQSVGLFSVIKEKLLSAGQPVTVAMFNTLFEVVRVCTCIIETLIAMSLGRFPALK